ncbi:MAG TPA: GIY-YIG nuclease family protein [Saprospiraceae bacterium]|nr:GIY-YIG nuclease family protein [Saprospiraceae bacterium]
MFFLYILESQKTGNLYIGQTNNLEDRFKRHQENRNKATKGRGPWILIYQQAFNSRAEAVQLELKLKSWKSNIKVKTWILSNKDTF